MFLLAVKENLKRLFGLVYIQNARITQAAIRPPTFVFFVNDAKLFSDTYRRYMEKQLRTDAGFAGTPIRLLWRSRKRSDKNGGGTSLTIKL